MNPTQVTTSTSSTVKKKSSPIEGLGYDSSKIDVVTLNVKGINKIAKYRKKNILNSKKKDDNVKKN